MTFRAGDSAAAGGNLFADLPQRLAREEVTTLLSSGALRIERIVSHGQASPPGFWYDQPQAEWVVVLAGGAELAFEGEAATTRMERGDWLHIPAHRRHRVAWTDPTQATIWLAVHHD
jgi:cupin 2 domain-containing protein